MWQKTLSFLVSVINIGNLLVENQQTLKELQKQVNTLEASMTLATERLEHFTELERANHQHFAEMERANHRNNLLELENRILQMERRLPPINQEKAE